jgi:uncharacterized protein YqgV (UPF0045/DUF77 family)
LQGTLPVQGNLKDLIKVALQMHELPFKKGALRVVTTVKIDDRRDREVTIAGKKEPFKENCDESKGLTFLYS